MKPISYCEVDRHHHVENYTPWRFLHNGPADALQIAISDEYSCDDGDFTFGQAEGILEDLKTEEYVVAKIRLYGEEDDCNVTFWRHRNEKDDYENFGFGIGDGIDDTSKHENIWLHLKEWDKPEREAELQAMTHEDLVSLIMRKEAVSPSYAQGNLK